MQIFQWDPKLELGIEMIDDQHKQIFSFANSFFINYAGGQMEKSAMDSIGFLQQYILYHFQAEEAFQVDCNYPGYRDHQAKHCYLAMQVKAQKVRLEASCYDKESVDNFHTFLANWIGGHILGEDMAFALYYKAQKKSR